MHYTKKLTTITVLMLIILLKTPVTASDSPVEHPVVLKINQHYILYLYPSVPFIDKSGSLMIPLRSFTELMGGKLTDQPETQSVQVAIGGKSTDIDLRLEPITLIEGTVFIKLRTLINRFDLKAQWDKENTLVEINDPILMQHEGIQLFEGMLNKAENEHAFDLMSFAITPGPKSYETTIEIKAKNITGSDICEGKEDLQLAFLYNDGIVSCESYTKSEHIRKFIGQNQVITKSEVFQDYDELFAIVALGRTITN